MTRLAWHILLPLMTASCAAAPPPVAPIKEVSVEVPVDSLCLVELKTRLPDPGASERVELYDPGRGRLISFVGYVPPPPGPSVRGEPRLGRFPGTVWSAAMGRAGLSDVRPESPLPKTLVQFGSYWGRAALSADGRHLLLTGSFNTRSALVAPLDRDGRLGAWRETTPLPPSPASRRSLHGVLVAGSWLYLLGGWHTDGQPGLTEIHRAPVGEDGSLGQFNALDVHLPAGAEAGFSLVRCGARGLEVCMARADRVWRSNLHQGQLSSFEQLIRDPRLDHVDYGGSGIAWGGGLLLLADVGQTHLLALESGGTIRLLRSLQNPAPFGQRTALFHDGRFYITTTHEGRIYKLEPASLH